MLEPLLANTPTALHSVLRHDYLYFIEELRATRGDATPSIIKLWERLAAIAGLSEDQLRVEGRRARKAKSGGCGPLCQKRRVSSRFSLALARDLLNFPFVML